MVTLPDRPLGTLAELGAFVILTLVLELVARAFAPPEERDPRLGAIAFWLSVAVVAVFMEVCWPIIKHRNDWLARGLTGLYWLCWAAWKAGVLQDVEDRQRDREQSWAVTVGAVAGIALHEFLNGAAG
jgi:hypothetical protein